MSVYHDDEYGTLFQGNHVTASIAIILTLIMAVIGFCTVIGWTWEALFG
jgi:hypothetical protein